MIPIFFMQEPGKFRFKINVYKCIQVSILVFFKSLHSKEIFYSLLTGKKNSDKDYEYVHNV